VPPLARQSHALIFQHRREQRLDALVVSRAAGKRTGIDRGAIGVGTSASQGEFKDIKVTATWR